jgi:hypothetical protein
MALGIKSSCTGELDSLPARETACQGCLCLFLRTLTLVCTSLRQSIAVKVWFTSCSVMPAQQCGTEPQWNGALAYQGCWQISCLCTS